MNRRQTIIAAACATVIVLIVLFPDWEAVQSSEGMLNLPLGNAWLFYPPIPPQDFTTLKVERGTDWVFIEVVVVIISGILYWLCGDPKRRPPQ
jgi:hypothetical protein